MRTFLAFVKKEFFHILRDRRTLFILLAMPIVQLFLFGYAVTNEFRDASIGILDKAKDPTSTELVAKLQASGHFLKVADFQTEQDIHEAFKEGMVKMAVVIPPDLERAWFQQGKAQIQLITDGTEPNTATTLISYASAMIADFQSEQLQLSGMPFPLHVETRMVYNPDLKSVYMFVPGVMVVILMLVSAMMTSLTLAREKELGTMELLLVSPLHPFTIILGKVVPYILISFIDALLILSIGVFVFEVPIRGSLLLLLGLCILFIVTALALGILISSRTTTQQAALLISLVGLMLPSILLSGFIFPLESMPEVLQALAQIVPAKWFIIMLKGVMLKGVGLVFLWKEVLILLGMTFFFLMVSFRNFKIRLS
jgi:ABC-2 type transport system permease protein